MSADSRVNNTVHDLGHGRLFLCGEVYGQCDASVVVIVAAVCENCVFVAAGDVNSTVTVYNRKVLLADYNVHSVVNTVHSCRYILVLAHTCFGYLVIADTKLTVTVSTPNVYCTVF